MLACTPNGNVLASILSLYRCSRSRPHRIAGIASRMWTKARVLRIGLSTEISSAYETCTNDGTMSHTEANSIGPLYYSLIKRDGPHRRVGPQLSWQNYKLNGRRSQGPICRGHKKAQPINSLYARSWQLQTLDRHVRVGPNGFSATS